MDQDAKRRALKKHPGHEGPGVARFLNTALPDAICLFDQVGQHGNNRGLFTIGGSLQPILC